MSNLILPPGVQASRSSRTIRRAAQVKAGLPPAHPINMQRRARIAPAAGCATGMGPQGPVLIVNLADGQQIPVPLAAEQAQGLGVTMISLAAQFELLQRMQQQEAEQTGADGEEVPLTPEMAELLAEAQGNTAGSSVVSTDEIDSDRAEADPAGAVETGQ